jgi:uncharacterized YigZ family protein
MKHIKENITNSITINKSEFITNLYKVNDLNEVNDILSKIRKKYHDATHNCYAYIIGNNQEIQKQSDDGEPSQTAGVPMIEVLKKNELTDILAITTRYFGGILLGAGGLIRAYSDSVSEALKKTTLINYEKLYEIKIMVDYPDYNNIVNYISNYHTKDQTFNKNIIVIVAVKENEIDSFTDKIKNLTNGKAFIKIIGSAMYETK